MRESYNFGVDTKAKQLYTETTNQGETMVEKRFIVKKCDDEYCIFDAVDDMNCVCVCDVERIADKTCDLLNELHEENQELKQSNEDARQILKKEFDFATAQRQKHLDDPVVANAYDIIRYDMRRALDKLGEYDD